MDDIEEDGEGGQGTVVLDLGDQALADAGLGGQFSKRDILLGSFGLDLIADKEKEFFVHV
jgi:hypothetical protein